MKRILGSLIFVAGCQTPIDPSMDAVSSRDLTLIHSACSPDKDLCPNSIQACSAVPNGGFDACRFVEETPIQSSWIIYLAYGGKVLDGSLRVQWQDIVKTYAIAEGQKELRIPWSDFFQDTVWKKDMSGIAVAVASLRVLNNEGVEEIILARGEARVLVLAKGYEPLPMDSGYAAFERDLHCRYIYTSKGRSVVRCK